MYRVSQYTVLSQNWKINLIKQKKKDCPAKNTFYNNTFIKKNFKKIVFKNTFKNKK